MPPRTAKAIKGGPANRVTRPNLSPNDQMDAAQMRAKTGGDARLRADIIRQAELLADALDAGFFEAIADPGTGRRFTTLWQLGEGGDAITTEEAGTLGKYLTPAQMEALGISREQYRDTQKAPETGPINLTQEERNFIFERFRMLDPEGRLRCQYCSRVLRDGRKGGQPRTIEHSFARSKGGTHRLENLFPACGSCNSIKQHHTWETFLVRVKLKDPRRRIATRARIQANVQKAFDPKNMTDEQMRVYHRLRQQDVTASMLSARGRRAIQVALRANISPLR